MANEYGIYKYLDEAYYNYSEKQQIIEMGVLFFGGFLISFLVGAPQMIVGIMVNAFLIRCALSLKGKNILPVVMAPSLGAAASGMLFGPMTPFLVVMMPFIWTGNLMLVYMFKAQLKHRYDFLMMLLAGAAVKTSLLFGASYVLFSMSAIPQAVFDAMGAMQFITCMIGGMIVYMQLKVEKRFA